jgi:hypothetical protein
MRLRFIPYYKIVVNTLDMLVMPTEILLPMKEIANFAQNEAKKIISTNELFPFLPDDIMQIAYNKLKINCKHFAVSR